MYGIFIYKHCCERSGRTRYHRAPCISHPKSGVSRISPVVAVPHICYDYAYKCVIFHTYIV